MSQSVVVLSPDELRALIREAVDAALAEHQGGDVQPALLDRNGIAKALGISPSTVGRLRAEGMPVTFIIDSPRFELSACLAWLRARSREKGPDS